MSDGRFYLGDGLHALDEGDLTWLLSGANAVALEPETFRELLKFMARNRKLRITVEDLETERKWVAE